MDLSGLVTSFLTGTYTVTRSSAASLERGRAESGTQTSLTIRASVSPASGRDLQRVPEGRRTTAAMAVFTTTELKPGGVGSSYEADVVSIGGSSWEVAHVEAWSDPRSGGTIYRCIAVATS